MGKFTPENNPFAAGPATEPAYLAGRDQELQTISRALNRITEARDEKTGILEMTPLAPIKIVGPRGVGKTTLLKEAAGKGRG